MDCETSTHRGSPDSAAPLLVHMNCGRLKDLLQVASLMANTGAKQFSQFLAQCQHGRNAMPNVWLKPSELSLQPVYCHLVEGHCVVPIMEMHCSWNALPWSCRATDA